jgi:hypothetical protein
MYNRTTDDDSCEKSNVKHIFVVVLNKLLPPTVLIIVGFMDQYKIGANILAIIASYVQML